MDVKRQAFTKLADGIMNALTGLGGSNDARAANRFVHSALSYQEATELYNHSWIAQKVIDLPVDDMLKNGREIHDLDGDDLEAYNEAWKELRCNEALSRSLRYARVVGGSAIIPIASDMDLAEPFNPRNFVNGRLQRFIVVDAHELSAAGDGVEENLTSPYYGMPRTYRYRGQEIDVSNIIAARGNDAPGEHHHQSADIHSSWGTSVFDRSATAIKDAEAVYANYWQLVHRNASDALKVPGFYENLADCEVGKNQEEMSASILARVMLLTRYRSIMNMAVLDDRESIERLQYNLSGMPEALKDALSAVCASVDMPLTRFSGLPVSGLNTNGDENLENHYNSIASQQARKLCPLYDRMDEYMTLTVFGDMRSLRYHVNSPHDESEEEKEERKKKKVETLETIQSMQIVPPSVIVRALQATVLPNISDDYIDALKAEEMEDDEDDDPDEPEGIAEKPEEKPAPRRARKAA